MDERDEAAAGFDPAGPRVRAYRLPTGPPVARRLGESGQEALRAVVVGVAALRAQLPLAVRSRIPPDLAARDEPATQLLAARVRRLAGALVRATVQGTGGDAVHAACVDVTTAVDAVPGLTAEDVKRHLEEAAPAAGELLREVGLDELDVDIAFDDSPGGGGPQGMWVPLSSRASDAALVPRALDRLLAWAVRDPLAELEIAAAQWAFAGYGGPRGEGQPQAALARMTREMEWLVLDRPALAFGGTVAQAFLASTRRDDPSPRLRGLVRSLARSFAGVFSVRRRRAGEAELSASRGRRGGVTGSSSTTITSSTGRGTSRWAGSFPWSRRVICALQGWRSGARRTPARRGFGASVPRSSWRAAWMPRWRWKRCCAR
jgi:hypothetical protein